MVPLECDDPISRLRSREPVDRPDRVPETRERGLEAAPDLVVEVLSDTTAKRDRGIKRERYTRFGVPQYWVVDADMQQIEVYRTWEDPNRPEIVRDELVWQLHPEAPRLTISVQDVLKGFE